MKRTPKKRNPFKRIFNGLLIIGVIAAAAYFLVPHAASQFNQVEVSQIQHPEDEGEPSIPKVDKEKLEALEDIKNRPEFRQQVELKAEETYLLEKKQEHLDAIAEIEADIEVVRHDLVSFE